MRNIEVQIHSPMGDIRVWLDADGVLNTTLTARAVGGDEAAALTSGLRAALDQASAMARTICTVTAPTSETAFARWLAERVVLDATARTNATDLYLDYCAWCAQGGRAAISHSAFGRNLNKHSIGRDGTDQAGRVMRLGARLITEAKSADVVQLQVQQARS